jgi:hypothetical protein
VAFAISAKHYALFELDDHGGILVRKRSEHGLGHLIDRSDQEATGRRWITRAREGLIAEALGRVAVPLGFEARPGLARATASSQALLHPFATYNAGKEPDARIRPFDFLLGASVAPFGHPPGVDPVRFHLIARYERDPRKWLRQLAARPQGVRHSASPYLPSSPLFDLRGRPGVHCGGP